jgi:tetratricopeptide (TPR) repeat protein
VIGKLFGWRQREPAPAPQASATEAKAQGNAALARGELAEAARCYRQAAQAEARDPLARLNLGYALLELEQPAEALSHLQQAIALRRPEDGFLHEAQFLCGRAHQAMARNGDAIASYRQALATQPGFEEPLKQAIPLLIASQRADEALALARQAMQALASPAPWMLAAQALHALNRPAEALALLDAVLVREPGHLGALESRGNLLLELDRNDEALAAFERLRAVHGPAPQTLTNIAVALLQLGQPGAALAVCKQGVQLHPQHAELQLNRALAHLLLGEWKAGWEPFESRWAAWTGQPPPWQDRPRWRGTESLAGRSILLFAEQGLGDTIQFLRYVPLVAAQAREVLLVVQPPLLPLAQALAPNCRVLPAGAPVPATDCQCPLLSLPLALGTTCVNVPAAIPYLHADAQRVALWRQRLGAGAARKVGITWSGNPVHRNDRNRSLPLALLRQLAMPDWQFVSLQPELRASDGDALAAWPDLVNLGPELRDFADTAAVMQSLDLVISVDTSVAHLAGALGRPTWILLPHSPDWRWMMERGDTPWYPSARLFRQPAPGDWPAVLAALRNDLQAAQAPPQ